MDEEQQQPEEQPEMGSIEPESVNTGAADEGGPERDSGDGEAGPGEAFSSQEAATDFAFSQRTSRRRRAAGYLGVVGAVMALMLTVGAVSAFAYDASKSSQIVPDTAINGVQVGGLTRDEAIEHVGAYVESVKSRRLDVKAFDKGYSLTLGELDLEADVEAAVDEAIEAGRRLGIKGRLDRWAGGGGEPINLSVEIRPSTEAVNKRVIAAIAGQVNKEPAEASIDEATDELIFRPAEPGRELEADKASGILEAAATSAANGAAMTEIFLPVREIPPPEGQIGHAILVRVGEQRLYHYENAELVGTYKVSTGTSAYPTPLGRFRVTQKIVNPSWTNPAPNGWGKDMPAYVPPGPNNPLGTRALQLNAPGILIHGTTKVNLLGSPASHGCVRMAGSDIESLFPKIPEGTPVFIRR